MFAIICNYLEGRKNRKRHQGGRRKEQARKSSTNLELQHGTAVVKDLDTKVVDVGRVGQTAAPVLHVAGDIKRDAGIALFDAGNSVAMVLRIEAPRNTCHGARLIGHRKDRVLEFYNCCFVVSDRK